MSIYSSSNAYSNSAPAGFDSYTLDNFVDVHVTPSITIYSQAFDTDHYRTATLHVYQYKSGSISTQACLYQIQFSNDGVTWYNFDQCFGAGTISESLQGTAAAPADDAYPFALSTRFTRVSGTFNSAVSGSQTLTIVIARITFSTMTVGPWA